MDAYSAKLYEFADVCVSGHWTEGFILKLTPEAVWAQVDVSISSSAYPIPPDQVAQFRSKRRGHNQDIDLQMTIHNAGYRLSRNALNKSYLESESVFVQFFAGLFPRYWKAAVIQGLTNETYESVCMVLTDFLTEAGRPKDISQPIAAASEAAWECVIPVLAAVLSTESLGHKVALFKAYLSAVVASNYSAVWVKSFESIKVFLMVSDEENRVEFEGNEKEELCRLFQTYLQYCIRLLLKEESFTVLLLFLRIWSVHLTTRSVWRKAEEAVWTSIEDLAFIADTQEFEPVKRDIILELCKCRSNCTGNALITNHFLNEQIVLSLLASSCGKSAAVRLSKMGLTVSFLKTYFPGDDWSSIVQDALWKEQSFVYMLDKDIYITERNVDELLSRMSTKEQAHYCEVGRADLSEKFQQFRTTESKGISLYYRNRRKEIMLIVMKARIKRAGNDVWRTVLQEFLYPRLR